MRQLKRRVTVCLIAMMAAGNVSTLAFSDSTEGSRSYGPALTLTGPEADLASKIHSGTNLKIDVPEGGNLAGTLVARGKGQCDVDRWDKGNDREGRWQS